MLRLIPMLASLTLALAPASAMAASYSAVPVAPAHGRIIAADISWTCGPDACQGSTDESRPLVLCQDLASRTGRLTSFLANGRAFPPADLEKCNLKAKNGAPLARAN